MMMRRDSCDHRRPDAGAAGIGVIGKDYDSAGVQRPIYHKMRNEGAAS
jgi:hypothetical protein